MSTSDESEASERDRNSAEVLEDDVSIVSVTPDYHQFRSIALRVLLALVFLGMGVGAVVYSVVNSENIESEKESPSGNGTEDYLNIRLSQVCDSGGTLTLEYRLNASDDDLSRRVTVTVGAAWVQDDSRHRLYHRVGLTADDWQYTVYVHDTFLIYSTEINCTKNYGMNYNWYLESLGLSHLTRSSHDGAVYVDGKNVRAYRYDGEPPASTTVQRQHPSLMIAYVKPDDGSVYGWESFFPSSEQLYRTELWFPKMEIHDPDQSVFFDFPIECEQIVINTTSPSLFFH